MREQRGTLTKSIHLRLDDELMEELERQARRDERTPSAVARRLIRAGLKAAQKKEAA